MNRRLWLALLGLVALGFLVPGVSADEPKHDHAAIKKCLQSCTECAEQCAHCFRHCAHQLAEGKKEHARTMLLCNDCADVCALAARIMGRHGPIMNPVCEACVKSCEQCGAACEKFEDEHMKACAKACKSCADACKEMLKHTHHEKK